MKHKKLQLFERQNIEIHLQDGLSYEEIARRLKRSISTISYEIKKGSVNGIYEAQKAHHKAYVRRYNAKYQGMKILSDRKLRNYVEEKIKEDWSPEIIAGRIKKHEKDIMHIGTDAIYTFIRSVYGRKLEKHLWYKNKRWKHNRKDKRKESLRNRLSIEKRPKYIEKRKQKGHYEADFIVSGRKHNSLFVLLVLIERSTRYIMLKLLENRENIYVNNAIFEMRDRVKSFRSLTLDNDIAFIKHRDLSLGLGAPVYFCHPFHSWEKGSVENVNKMIRRYIKKGDDLSKYSDSFIASLEKKLNERPRKILDFLTPQELMKKFGEIKSPSD